MQTYEWNGTPAWVYNAADIEAPSGTLEAYTGALPAPAPISASTARILAKAAELEVNKTRLTWIGNQIQELAAQGKYLFFVNLSADEIKYFTDLGYTHGTDTSVDRREEYLGLPRGYLSW